MAQQYAANQLPTVALELRQQAEALDLQQPLAGVVTSLTSWQGADAAPALPAPAPEPVAHATNSPRKMH